MCVCVFALKCLFMSVCVLPPPPGRQLIKGPRFQDRLPTADCVQEPVELASDAILLFLL